MVAAISIEAGDRVVDITSGTFTRTTGSYTAFSFASSSSGEISLGTDFQFRGTITKFAASARGRVDNGEFIYAAKGWGRITSAGALDGITPGLASAVRNGVGDYTITLDEAFVTTDDLVVTAVADTNIAITCVSLPTSTSTVDIHTFNAAGTAIDINFKVLVHGR